MKRTLLNYLAYSDFGQMSVSIVAVHSAQDDIQSQSFLRKVFLGLRQSKICASESAISPTQELCEKNGYKYTHWQNMSLNELETIFNNIDWFSDVELWAYNCGFQFILQDVQAITEDDFNILIQYNKDVNILKIKSDIEI